MCLVFVFVVGLNIVAQDRQQNTADEALEKAEILAQSAPPAYAARALIKLASGVEGSERARLVAEARQYATVVRYSYPSISTAPLDSLEGVQANASLIGIDKLSLQTAAATTLLSDNKPEARRAFAEISVDAPPSSCGDTVHPDLTKYYLTAAKVANLAFTERERRVDDDLHFSVAIVSSLQTSAHLEGAMRFVLELQPVTFGTDKHGEPRIVPIVRALAVGVQNISVSDVGLFARLPAIASTVQQIARRYAVARSELSSSFAQLARQQLRNACLRPSTRTVNVNLVNKALCGTSKEGCTWWIRAEEVSDIGQEPVPVPRRLTMFWTDQESSAALAAFKSLRTTINKSVINVGDEAESAKRAGEVLRFVSTLERWKPSPGKQLVVAVQKAMLLERTLDLADVSIKPAVLDEYVSNLTYVDTANERTPIWFWFATRVKKHMLALRPEDRLRFEQFVKGEPALLAPQ